MQACISCRKPLQRAGKDHSIVLVLPSGVYHYKFIVDGEQRYIPELPHVADETGRVCNLLDVNVCVFCPSMFLMCFYLDINISSSYEYSLF